MWPVLLDITKEESMQSLRNLELEAYAHLVSALRAQGPLSPDKRKLLKDTSQVLNIPQDRHKAEVRRAVNDEKLNTIAYHVTGFAESLEEWAQEGRRSVPLIPRMAPQTAYSAIADEAAEHANLNNKQMPHPASTERKRPQPQPTPQMGPETSKGAPFRVPETPKTEESKKRKYPICTEGSTLAQHLLGPPKMNRTPQIYRQRTKSAIMKEPLKLKPGVAKQLPFGAINGPKINLLQNVVINPPHVTQQQQEETIEQIQNEINSYHLKSDVSTSSSENQPPRPKLAKPATNMTFKQLTTNPGPSPKACQPKKPLGKTTGVSIGQKLIVVSNAQTIQNSNILQKTLSIPLVKNISVKNFEKFKIVTTASPQISGVGSNLTTFKHKVVTVKTTNSNTKKVIPLSLINSKGGIKVLPIGGKIVGKGAATASSPPLYIVNTMSSKPVVPALEPPPNSDKDSGKSSVLGDILKASGVTTDDFDTQIEEFRIPNNHVVDDKTDVAVERAEAEEKPTEDFIILEGEARVVEETTEATHEEGYESGDKNVDQLEAVDEVMLDVQNTETSVSEDGGN